MSSRHRHAEESRVDRLARHTHLGFFARQHRDETAFAQVVTQRVVADPATGQEALAHLRVEVTADLRARGELAQALIDNVGVFALAAQRHGADPIKGRALAQGHKGAGIVPVAAGLAVAGDHGDAGVGFLQQGVGKCQTESATADDQIVGIPAA